MIRFLVYLSKGLRMRILSLIAIGIGEVALTLLFVWSSKALIDVATGDRQGSLLSWSLFLGGQILLQIALRAAEVRLTQLTEVKLGNRVRHTLFSHLLYVEWHVLSGLQRGDMLTRLIHDTDDLVRLLTSVFPLSVSALLQLSGAFLFLALLDPQLALILALAMPLLLLLSRVYYFPMKHYTREVKESESSITSLIEESLVNQVVIRTFERQQDELGRLGTLQEGLHGKVDRKSRLSLFARFVTGVAFQGGYLVAFIRGAYGVARETITFGTLTAFLQLVGRIQRPLFELMRLLPVIITAKAASERLSAIIGMKKEKREEKVFFDDPVSLVIRNLSYTYPGEREPVIRQLNLSLAPGSMVAVMGETGVGKTTLVRLILSLIQADSGSIMLTDGDREVSVSVATRTNFVYVPQENLLFSGTIRENLLVGDPTADDAALQRVLEIACAAFVLRLPEGLDTPVGEGGFGLSEGEAQRITIARSLLRPGRILLLDEATSALDPETGKQLLQNLKRELSGRSALFITHHPEVAAQCDWVTYL
ncbi:MAG: ABC transporter ATP-binding protein [Proteiniphilum sp.]|nr:ABC transporter ATP-binding protein [Proteiniphilum sp.]